MKMNLQLFAGTNYLVDIYSNDGQTKLNNNSYTLNGSQTLYVTSTGVNNSNSETSPCYTYSGNKIFAGLTTTANSSTIDLPVGYSETLNDTITAFPSIEDVEAVTLYIVEQETTVTYKHLLKDGSKIQVDSAIRDGNGLKIDTNYEKIWKTLVNTGTLSTPINAESDFQSYTSKYDLSSILDSTMKNTLIDYAEEVKITMGLKSGSTNAKTNYHIAYPSILKIEDSSNIYLGFTTVGTSASSGSGLENKYYRLGMSSQNYVLSFNGSTSSASKLVYLKIEYK